MSEKIIENNIVKQYKEDIIKYAIYDNRSRSVPYIKDGLKPVHRRILYAGSHDEKCTENRRVKSAAIVGTVLKKYHPHGDVGVYGAMKPMTNPFEIYIPLLYGQGNWGTLYGDGAAAMRYTESGVSKFAYECVIGDMLEAPNITDWSPNYNNDTQEPDYLPIKIPLLLINGGFGIGYGITTKIPRHNINEVIDATIKLMHDPNAEIVLIPDQCLPCEIINTNFKAISNKGNGKFIARAIIEVKHDFTLGRFKNVPALLIKSLPDLTYFDSIEKKIEDLVDNKKLPQILSINVTKDPKTKRSELIVLLKKGTDPEYMKEILYKNTDLSKTIGVNFEVADDTGILRMSYKSYLQYFIELRKLTIFRYYCIKLQDAKTKMHEKEIFIKVCQSGEVDNIIKMIRNQSEVNDNGLIEYLIKTLNITDIQASYIINSNIKKLSPAYLNRYIEEREQLKILIDDYMNKINNDDLILQEIEKELLYFKSKYGRPRNCIVIDKAEADQIPKGSFKIVITENNFIKKVQLNDTIGSFKNDNPKFVIKVENEENILLFDEQGKVFKLPVHKIPVSDKHSNGIDIRIIIKKLTSNIIKVMYEPLLNDLSKKKTKYFISVLTNLGNVKKLDLSDFLAVPPSGIIYSKLDEIDFVKSVNLIANGLDIIVYSKTKALRMNISEIPHLKRNTKGNKSMDSDNVDGLAVIHPDSTDVIVITESGKINRFDIVALPCTGRAKAGSKVIKLSKNDNIKYIFGVNINKDVLKVNTKLNKMEFNIHDIPTGSSISSGTKMIPLKGDNIIKCEIIKK